MDLSVAAICNPENRLATVDRTVFQFLGSWSRHVRSWTAAQGLEPHVVRYEDMLRKPTKTFGAVAEFLGVAPSRERLTRAIRFSAFGELQAQERRQGFREASEAGHAFFRTGRSGQWRKALTTAQIDRIVSVHGELMAQYGYLPQAPTRRRRSDRVDSGYER